MWETDLFEKFNGSHHVLTNPQILAHFGFKFWKFENLQGNTLWKNPKISKIFKPLLFSLVSENKTRFCIRSLFGAIMADFGISGVPKSGFIDFLKPKNIFFEKKNYFFFLFQKMIYFGEKQIKRLRPTFFCIFLADFAPSEVPKTGYLKF